MCSWRNLPTELSISWSSQFRIKNNFCSSLNNMHLCNSHSLPWGTTLQSNLLQIRILKKNSVLYIASPAWAYRAENFF